MSTPRIVTILILSGCGVSTDEVTESVTTPVISSVRTDDGFRQVRQNDQVVIVIRGHGLDLTTAVTVGSMFVTLDAVAEAEVRATLSTDTVTPVGPLDVTLASPAGATTATGALRLTPFVVSPTATTGHGTFQSPMSLCDPELELAQGLILLQVGTHVCGRTIFLGGGVTLQGDRQAPTIVTGTAEAGLSFELFGSPEIVTTVRDLTLAAPLNAVSLDAFNNLTVERVNNAAGVLVSNGTATLDRYHFEGPGTGATLLQGTVTRSTFRHCDEGIVALATGGVTVDHTTVEDCTRGLVARGGRLEVRDARLIDNRVGLRIEADGAGFEDIVSSIEDSIIRDDPATPAVSNIGIEQTGDELVATRVTITGQAQAGISIIQTSSMDRADFQGDSLEIVGGPVGLSIDGIDNSLRLHNSTIRGQSAGSLSIGTLDSNIDVSNNAFSARRGGFAIVNNRQFDSTFSRYVNATGTTLNGVSFAGSTLEGPLSLPPYIQIVDGDSGFRF